MPASRLLVCLDVVCVSRLVAVGVISMRLVDRFKCMRGILRIDLNIAARIGCFDRVV